MTTARMTSSHGGTVNCRAAGVTFPLLPWLQQDQRGRAEQDDPQRREDAADHRQHHLQRRLRGLFLRPLAPLAAHLVSLDAQDLADAGAELLRLDDRLDEVVQVLDAAAPAHLVHGLESRPAEADLTQNLGELLGQRVLVLVGDTRERGIETKTGVDGDDEQVHRVRQALLDLRPAGVHLLLQPHHRQVVAQDRADRERDDQVHGIPEKEAEPQSERRQHGRGHDPDRAEVLRRQVAGPAGKLEPVHEVLTRLRRRGARQYGAQPFDRRAQEPLAERSLQLDLLHRQRLLAAVDREALLDQLGSVHLRGAREAQEDDENADADAEGKKRYYWHQVIPLSRPRDE